MKRKIIATNIYYHYSSQFVILNSKASSVLSYKKYIIYRKLQVSDFSSILIFKLWSVLKVHFSNRLNEDWLENNKKLLKNNLYFLTKLQKSIWKIESTQVVYFTRNHLRKITKSSNKNVQQLFENDLFSKNLNSFNKKIPIAF